MEKKPYFWGVFWGSFYTHTNILFIMGFKYVVLLFCGGFLLLTSISQPLSSGKKTETQVSKKRVATIGEQIRSGRVAHRMSKKELATAIDLTVAQLENIESNAASPSKEVLFKAQEVLNVEFVLDNY